MQTYLSFSIMNALGFELGEFGFHSHVMSRSLHLCFERRLVGERWAWIERGVTCTTGRLGPISLTAGRLLSN
jgi:hypothetical protein